MPWLEVRGLQKTYPGGVSALKGVSFEVERGEFFTVVGPSNAGKSTLLKSIAGVEPHDAGTIRLAGDDIGRLEPRLRRLSLLFQNIALFPTRTGFENIAFPLRVTKAGEAEVDRRVRDIAALLNVSHVLDRMPRTFSGGERQRVAIGRALVYPADLLMLDEPLTNLDARIRTALRIEFKRLHQSTGQTLLYVTHDQVEAMSLSDRIGVLRDGQLEQVGTPDEVYHRPATEFVARFIGTPPMNILPARLVGRGGDVKAIGDGFEASVGLPGSLPKTLPGDTAIGIRAEEIRAAPQEGPDVPIAGKVEWIERLGSYNVLDVRVGAQIVKVRVRPEHPALPDSPVWLGFTVRPQHILNRATGRFLQVSGAASERESTQREVV